MMSRRSLLFEAPLFRPGLHTKWIRPYSTAPLMGERAWTKLPAIKVLVEQAIQESREAQKPLPFEDTAIWYVQHSFETSLSVLDAFIALGAKPSNIGIIDKAYSRCEGVEQAILKRGVHYTAGSLPARLGGFKYSFMRDISQALTGFMERLPHVKRIIAVSHGQNFFDLIPAEIFEKYPIVGIEKTTAGLSDSNIEGLPFPIINMAGCAAKLVLESPIIADEVVKKALSFVPLASQTLTCGVVGYGNIGRALTNKLLSMGHRVIVYDRDPHKLKDLQAKTTRDLSALIGYADCIFGCTGRDITEAIDLFNFARKDKILISCSSADVEFLSMLHLIQKKYNGKVSQKPLSDLEYVNEDGVSIRVLRGGYPINFDGISEGSTPQTIQLTRALSVASVLHASQLFDAPDLVHQGGVIKLSAPFQRTLTQAFLRDQPQGLYTQETIDHFNDEAWISKNSNGEDRHPQQQDKSAARPW